MKGDVRLMFDPDGRQVYVPLPSSHPHVEAEEGEFLWPFNGEEEDEGAFSALFEPTFGDTAISLEFEQLVPVDLGKMIDLVVPRPHFGLGVVELGSCLSVINDRGMVEPSLMTWVLMDRWSFAPAPVTFGCARRWRLR